MITLGGQKFLSSTRNYKWNLERTSNSSQSTCPVGRITRGSHITYYSLMFFIAYTFKGQVHVFAGWVKIVSHSSCRTSTILKYFCPLTLRENSYLVNFKLVSVICISKSYIAVPLNHVIKAWVKVFRIIPELRILRLIFHRKSASKCWIMQLIIAFLI